MTLRPTYDEEEIASLDSASLGMRLQMFLSVVAIVTVLSAIKAGIHWLGLEFLSMNPLFTSAISGAIFIIGFLLSSILSDYKEAERLPAEIRMALEGIHDDIREFSVNTPIVNLQRVRALLLDIIRSLHRGLSAKRNHEDLRSSLKFVDMLSGVFGELERLGMQPNFVTRLRSEQDIVRRALFRIYHIQSTQFVPSIHILVYSLVASVIFMMLFLKTEGSPESALMFGFVSYMFIYALRLIGMLEKPFRKGQDTLDDVSLFLLRELDQKLSAAISAGEPSAVTGKGSKAETVLSKS